jgi:glycosyltransferase involved in cell wall biosynthesis
MADRLAPDQQAESMHFTGASRRFSSQASAIAPAVDDAPRGSVPGAAPISGILFAIPWPSNEGYAMHRAESQFFEIGLRLTADPARIHFSFADFSGGHPRSLPTDFHNFATFNFRHPRAGALEELLGYVRSHRIDVLVGYDLRVENPTFGALRRASIQTIVSYWGAPMSGPQCRPTMWLKKLEVKARRNRPDLFIFQCEAMRSTGVDGRGIPRSETAVAFTGVDTALLVERARECHYAHDLFGLPRDKQIVVYSGHVVPRKGIAVLLRAADLLVNRMGRTDVHFVILGRIQQESQPFIQACHDLKLDHDVTFAGYRNDVFDIFACCAVGVIPTTGWDSFPRSVLEIQGCGVPIVASRLQGLPEMIVEGSTGLSFTPGDHVDLAAKLADLLSNSQRNWEMGTNARARIMRDFDQNRLISELTELIRTAHSSRAVQCFSSRLA